MSEQLMGALVALAALGAAPARADMIFTDRAAFLAHVGSGYYLGPFDALPQGIRIDSPLSCSGNGFGSTVSTEPFSDGFFNVGPPGDTWLSTNYPADHIVFRFTSGNVEFPTVNDLIVGTSVPEPSALLLAGLGLAGLLGRACRRRPARPRVEALETRVVPANHSDCIMTVVDGHILQVVGDHDDDNVLVVQDAAGVTVACNGFPAHRFAGIDQVRVDTRAGADTVEVWIPPDPVRPALLDVVLGDGNDVFRLRAVADVGFSADPLAPSRTRVDGGRGLDRIDVAIGAAERRVAVRGLAVIHLDGGGDADTIAVALAGVDLRSESRLGVNADGGAGDDAIGFHAANSVILGSLDVSLSGFTGNDHVAARLESSHNFSGSTAPPPPPTFRLSGHLGNDRLDYLTDWTAGDVECDGGDGDDTLSSTAGVDWAKLLGNDPQFVPAEVSFRVVLRGGNGSDRITSRMGVEPTPFVPPLIRCDLTVDGGAGSDVLDAVFGSAATRKVAELNVSLLAGDGDDALRLLWSAGAFEARAFADGGRGFDTGLFSPGVRHVNVERVG